jgi:hypothetical protein
MVVPPLLTLTEDTRLLQKKNPQVNKFYHHMENGTAYGSEPPDQTKKLVCCAGCSFTRCIGIPVDRSWPVLLAEMMGESFQGLNFGWPGAGFRTVTSHCVNWVAPLRPYICVIEPPPFNRQPEVEEDNLRFYLARKSHDDAKLGWSPEKTLRVREEQAARDLHRLTALIRYLKSLGSRVVVFRYNFIMSYEEPLRWMHDEHMRGIADVCERTNTPMTPVCEADWFRKKGLTIDKNCHFNEKGCMAVTKTLWKVIHRCGWDKEDEPE